MRIVPKLTLALFCGTCLILAVNGYLRVRREIAFFEADRVSDHDMIGRSVGAAVAAAWKSEGEASALATVDAVNSHFTRIQIRWVAASDHEELPIDAATLAASPAGTPVTRVTRDSTSDLHLYTFVPIDIDGTRRGAIELVEAGTSEKRFAAGVLEDAVLAAGALAVLSALLSFVMGQLLVGGPVRAISAKARRIGLGDFAQPLDVASRDELGDLARDVNVMCDRLQTTITQLRHADRLATVGKLASGIAHELGTPLNVVSARAEMIAADEATSEDAKRDAEAIVGAVERMAKIIRQLLQFARRSTANKARCDLGVVVRDAIELLKPLTTKRNAEVKLTCAVEDASLDADAGQLQQVVMNLVMNAVQSLEAGGLVEVRVEATAAARPAESGAPDDAAAAASCLCVCVKDHGVGISEQDLSRVFEPFFTTKDVGEGTGLGLAVAHGIVRDHGGWIAVESGGAGTTFTVYLPRGATS